MTANVFPTWMLRPGDTALCLFCAAFGGAQDAAFLRDAGMRRVFCVDNDLEKIHAMRPAFPGHEWALIVADGFEAIDSMLVPRAIVDAATGQEICPKKNMVFDVVTADPWSGDMDVRVREALPKLLALTRRVLILGCGVAAVPETRAELARLGVENPVILRRSSTAAWICVEKAS